MMRDGRLRRMNCVGERPVLGLRRSSYPQFAMRNVVAALVSTYHRLAVCAAMAHWMLSCLICTNQRWPRW
jgi:hypothetical protein